MTIIERTVALIGMGCKEEDILNSDTILAVGYWKLPPTEQNELLEVVSNFRTDNELLEMVFYSPNQSKKLLLDWLDSVKEEKPFMLAITDLNTLWMYGFT